MTRRSFIIFVATVLLLANGFMSAFAETRPLTIFAAASLKGSLDQVARAFEAETGEKIVVSYAASSALAKQIEAGAPADIFLSADLKWMDYLIAKGAVADGSNVKLLSNRLVLVGPKGAAGALKIEQGFDLLGALGKDGLLAMGDPKSVPAGTYAQEALENLGAWDSVKQRITASENVRVAAALVARGEAPLGIVYETDALISKDLVTIDVFPDSTHAPIVYPVAPIKASTHPATANLMLYLQSQKALQIFRDAGFSSYPPIGGG